MKKWILTFVALAPVVSFAQVATPADTSIMNDPMFPLYFLTGAVFVVLVLIMMVVIYIIKILNLFTQKAAEEKAAKEGRVYVPEPSLIERFISSLNASVPVEQEKTIELDHNYDGIRELDNHLPPWWKWLFYGTIVWAFVYLIMYHVTDSMPLQEQEYEDQVAQAEEAKLKLMASQPTAVIDENTLEYSADAAILENGKKVFTTNCSSCHRADGGGNSIGPNLTDQYWIHGGNIKQIFATIKNGAKQNQMPAWGKMMKPSDVRDVAFYVMSLQGSNPPDPKAPQGNLEKPTELPKAKADSVNVTTDSVKVTASVN